MEKLSEKITGIGLILVLLTFNPLISPGLYFDSTRSYVFLSAHKVLLLAVINLILLGIWTWRVFKTKELNLTSTKIFLPVYLWVASFVLSTVFSINRQNSIYGFEATLQNSLFEMLMLFVFFFFVANNIRGQKAVQFVLRCVNISMSIIVVWLILRYSGGWSNGSIFFREYFNSTLFTPSGHYGSLLALVLASFFVSIGLVVTNILESKDKTSLIIDSLSVIILGTGFMNLLNVSGRTHNYFYMVLALVGLGLIFFMILNNKNLRNALVPVASLVGVSVILGLASYFGLTSTIFKGFNYPSVPIDVSWDVSVNSIHASLNKGFIGNGPSNFTYAFDLFKNESLVPNNLTINNNAPSVPELRINHAGSYFLEVLNSQGLLGIITFILVLAVTLYVAFRKLSSSTVDFTGIFVLLGFVTLALSTLVTGYDFSLLLLMWLYLGLTIAVLYEMEPTKSLNISMASRTMRLEHNFNYFFTLILLVCSLVTLYNGFFITSANVSAFWAKRYQSINDLANYQRSSLDAVNKYPNSDVFIRELVNANGAILIQNIADLSQQVTKDPQAKQKQEVINQFNYLGTFQKGIMSSLFYASNNYPDEYKNYYLAGILISRLSEFSNLSQDSSALDYFNATLLKNPTHPDTYYQIALIQERNKNPNAAFTAIRQANAYDVNNIIYQLKFADILVEVQGYDQGLTIYNNFKKLKEQNPSNQQIAALYDAQQIDKKIETAQKLKDEAAKQQQQTGSTDDKSKALPTPLPTTSPVLTLTPTVTPKKK